MNFQPIQLLFSLVLVALSVRTTIEKKLAFWRRNSVEQNLLVCVEKQIAVTTLNQTMLLLAADA